jgi:hypothetical protein
LFIQLVDFVWDILRLDFGTSMWSGNPITTEIWAGLLVSLEHSDPTRRTVCAQAEHPRIDVLVRVLAVG